MNSFLVHGVYDPTTYQTLSQLGVNQFGFDLRGKSPNLIPFRDLNLLLSQLITERAFLIFEDDKSTTILSFLNLLKSAPLNLLLEMRDRQSADYYNQLDHDFFWMFHPECEWKEILNCPKLKGVLLPYRWKDSYQKMPHLWETIERRGLEVFLHAENLQEASSISLSKGLNLSTDLTLEVEKGFRKVDQDYLKKLPLWSKYNENNARQ